MFKAKFIKNNHGSALMITILILASILVVVLGVSEILTRGLQNSKISGLSGMAYLAAESGAEKTLYLMRKTGFSPSESLAACSNEGYIKIDVSSPVCNNPITAVYQHTLGASEMKYSVKYKYDETVTPKKDIFTVVGYYQNGQRSIKIGYEESE
ncbi:MAG: hypothetical protein M0Q92_00620 [Methanoregula sp.]|jgi:hypothetical protein|nr:hypothetical protein [Methanoregula sp.]